MAAWDMQCTCILNGLLCATLRLQRVHLHGTHTQITSHSSAHARAGINLKPDAHTSLSCPSRRHEPPNGAPSTPLTHQQSSGDEVPPYTPKGWMALEVRWLSGTGGPLLRMTSV